MLRRHGVEVGLYADDLDISATDRDVDTATTKVQAALDELHEWAETWGMQVSETKTKSILFTTHRDEVNAKRRLHLCLGDSVLEQVEEVSILGVKFDTQLTFRQHIEATKTKADRRIGAMKALAGTRWGCRENTLRKLYKSFVRPVILYGSSTYIPFASNTNREKVERSARAAARVITACPVDTRCEALMTEANLRSITSLGEEQAAILRERTLRLNMNIPAHQTAQKTVKKRLKNRDTWRDKAVEIATEAGLENRPREMQTQANQAPWESKGTGHVSFHLAATEAAGRAEGAEARKVAYDEYVRTIPPAQAVYHTDGSATSGFGDGGGGITRQEEEGRGNKTWAVPAGTTTSSFRTELVAFRAALEDALLAPPVIQSFRICTDSLSLLQKLKDAPWKKQPASLTAVQELITEMSRRGWTLQMVWVPGHAGVEQNEEADRAANEGRNMNQEQVPTDLMSAKTAIRRTCRRRWAGSYHSNVPPDHIHRQISDGQPPKGMEKWSRREQTVMHQLRVDRCPLLPDTLRRWRRPDEDGLCKECKEPFNVKHYIQDCIKFQNQRTRLLGPIPSMQVLQEDPEAARQFVRATGLLRGTLTSD